MEMYPLMQSGFGITRFGRLKGIEKLGREITRSSISLDILHSIFPRLTPDFVMDVKRRGLIKFQQRGHQRPIVKWLDIIALRYIQEYGENLTAESVPQLKETIVRLATEYSGSNRITRRHMIIE